MEERFYYCGTCGNLLFASLASGITPYCCGDEMTLLKANQDEGYGEKHLPVVTKGSDGHTLTIKIGAQPHPMSPEHSIKFVCVETDLGIIIRYLNENDTPEVTIHCDGKPRKVFAYCNVHGLWLTNLSS